MCLRNRLWTRVLVAAIVFRLVTAEKTTTAAASATINVTTTTTTLSPSSEPLASISLTTTTLTAWPDSSTSPARTETSSQRTSHTSLQSKRTDNLKLHRAASRGGRGNEMIQCLNGCSSSRCRESCLKRELSDEEIVERTQRCHNDCKDEPEELIQMCIQKCTYYLMDPVEHSLEEEEESTSTDAGGLLPDSPHLRTRIRLIGPDGLPVISTVYDDDDQAAEVGDAVGSATESATTSDTWTPAYRVRILNDAAGHAEQLGWVLWCAVVALCLALYA